MRFIRSCALVLAVLIPSLVHAAGDDLTQRRQAVIDRILASDPLDHAKSIRENCAAGGQPAVTDRGRNAGLTELPDVADYCVTALTRLGRATALGYVRDTRSTTPTPALSFDNGFVAAYLKHEAVPTNLPSMPMLKSTAEGCLRQAESDTDLCYSVGYAYGIRASNGEVVRVQ